MQKRRENEKAEPVRGDRFLIIGLFAIVAGLWLLMIDDPMLLKLWAVALLINGTAATITGLGIVLGLWE